MRRTVFWAAVLPLLSCDEPHVGRDVERPHVPAEYPGWCLEEVDYGRDGGVDEAKRVGWDRLGRNVMWDLVRDGDTLHHEAHTYGERDLVVQTDELDRYGDRDRWVRHQLRHDADGREILHDEDWGRDGDIDSRRTTERDAAGRPVRETVDYGADGDYEYRYWHEYDADGNWTLYAEDKRRDGGALVTLRRRFERGQLAELTIDLETDGVIDQRSWWEYDAEGRETYSADDEDMDGDPESQQWHEHAPDGLGSVWAFDEDGDDRIEKRYVRTWSADGAHERYEQDDDGDGTPEQVHLIEQGPGWKRIAMDLDADGDPDEVLLYVNDPDEPGHRLRWERDEDADGQSDEITTWRYGPLGLDEERTVNAAGEVTDYERWTRDTFGNVLSVESPDRLTTYTYRCPWSWPDKG